MYHDTEHYRLSFKNGGQHTSATPELIFTVNAAQLPVILDRLALLYPRLCSAATTYFLGTRCEFVLATPDLLGQQSFGYNRCGYIVTDDRGAHIHLPLRGALGVSFTAFTLQLLKTALLHIDPNDVALGNGLQQCDLDLCTDNFRPNGYGHALGGYLAHSVTAWLEAYCAKGSTARYSNGDAPMHPEVVKAMRDAWRAIARESWQEYIDDCGGRVDPRGAFGLYCFGNACDAGVYPSEFHPDEPAHAISCHNLDTAEQQLTLLAGLAKLCELARADQQ